MAMMPLTKVRRSGDDGQVFPFLFCWSDIFFIGALPISMGCSESRSKLQLGSPTFRQHFDLRHGTEDLSGEELIPGSAIKALSDDRGRTCPGLAYT